MLPGLGHAHMMGGALGNPTLFQVLTTLGLTTNLRTCLDAGDAASYTSGQVWNDTSGGGNDFFLGTTNAVEGSDPTFNGVAGALSANEYFSFHGTAQMNFETANPSWITAMHQNNAIFSWAMWVWTTGTSGSVKGFFGDAQGAGNGTGIAVYLSSAGNYKFRCLASAATACDLTHSGAYGNGWRFYGGSLNEATGANGASLCVDGVNEQFTSTYTSPAASGATSVATIGKLGTSNFMPNSHRVPLFALWGGTALTGANLIAIYNATRGRYGV